MNGNLENIVLRVYRNKKILKSLSNSLWYRKLRPREIK